MCSSDLTSIDSQGINQLFKIIKTRQKDDESKIFIISHSSELEDVDEMLYNETSLLGLFDGDSQQDNMLIWGTTNYLDRLPPRMTRYDRYDRVIEIGNSDIIGRKA